jgi:hypothetical protein
MNDMQILRALNHIDPDLIAAACEEPPRRQRGRLLRYASVAAACLVCLGAVLLIVRHGSTPDDIVTPQPDPDTTTEPDTTPEPPPIDPSTIHAPSDAQDGRPHVYVGEVMYGVSGHRDPHYADCPDGFTYAGEVEEHGHKYPYYAHPDYPYLIYVYHDVAIKDSRGQLVGVEKKYVRYVHMDMCMDQFIFHDGALYVRLADAKYAVYGDHPYVSDEYLTEIKQLYRNGYSYEEFPSRFVLIGVTEFSGYDILPTKELQCNVPKGGALQSSPSGSEVYYDSERPDVLALAVWASANHLYPKSYEIYIRCGTGLAEEDLLPWLRTQPQ